MGFAQSEDKIALNFIYSFCSVVSVRLSPVLLLQRIEMLQVNRWLIILFSRQPNVI